MSVIRRVIAVMLAFLLFIPMLPAPPAHASGAIEFGDPAVEQAVRAELGLSDGPITEEDITVLLELTLPSNSDIRSLKGLEYAVNLRKLYTGSNQIEDLTPLSQLMKLTLLQLYSNNVTDLSPLSGLLMLETIHLNWNPITDLSPLVSIASLKLVDVTSGYLDITKESTQAAINTLQQRGVTLQGLSAQRKPPYVPKIAWTPFFDDMKDYRPSQYAFGNGIYVSADQHTSTDGVHWTSRDRDDRDRFFYKVVFGQGLFLGIEYGSIHGVPIWTSKDGIAWTKSTVIEIGATFTDIVFTGKRFVLITDDSLDENHHDGVLATSEDGLTWKVHPKQLERGMRMLAWGNGTLLALSDKSIYKSSDGIAWKKVALPISGALGSILYAQGKFIIAADRALISSTDGTKWHAASTAIRDWEALVHAKDRYFASSRNESGATRSYMTSKDGKSWSPMKVPDSSLEVQDIAFEGSKYVARSFWAHYASDDGVTWKLTKKVANKPILLNRAAIGDGKLVAVGGNSSTWGFFRLDASGRSTYNRIDDQYKPLRDVIWTGKQFFAVGSGGLMMTSKDGASWKKVASPTTERLNRIIQANDTYYVTGTGGLIMTSKDLVTWKKLKTGKDAFDILSIAWNGKKFVAVGQHYLATILLTSDNGVNWKSITLNTKSPDGSPALKFTDVTWGNGTFVISAEQNYHLDLPYTVYVSSDGAKWTRVGIKYETTRERNWSPSLLGVSFTGGQFVALGNNGSVYVSKDGKEWGREEVPKTGQMISAQYYNGKLYVFGYLDIVYVGQFKP